MGIPHPEGFHGVCSANQGAAPLGTQETPRVRVRTCLKTIHAQPGYHFGVVTFRGHRSGHSAHLGCVKIVRESAA